MSLALPAANWTDADAQRYIIAAGISDATQMAAANRAAKELKGYALWSKMIAFYPIIGGTAARHAENLISASYQITWTNGPTHDSNGVKGNGSTQYGTCGSLFSATIGTTGGMTAYLREAITASPGRMCGMSSATDVFALDEWAALDQMRGIYGAVTVATHSAAETAGCFTVSRESSTSLKLYRGGSNTATATGSTTVTTDSTYAAMVLASNASGTATFFTSQYFGGFAFHTALNATEAANLYTVLQNMNTVLGRQI